MLIEKIVGIRKQAIKNLREKHNIAELAQSCFEDILNRIKENPFMRKTFFIFYYDDENMQKYYLDDFEVAIQLLKLEFDKEGFFNVRIDYTACGERTIYLEW
jgi:hypothetical protein